MKKIKYALLTILSVFTILSVVQPAPVYAQSQNNNNCTSRFLTFPAWYRGLPRDADCGVRMMEGGSGSTSGDNPISRTIWVIALNVVEIIIQLVGYVSVAFIIIGGWRYILSNGSADGNVRGRKTILNAVIGLILALSSVAIVNTIVGSM